MSLPKINDSAWGWKNENGLYARGVEPLWEIHIRCGWIEVDYYPTTKACTIGSIMFPAPKNDKEAMRLAEESATILEGWINLVITKNF